MTITLMRKNLSDITKNLKSAHAGLLMQRGLREWADGEKPIKKKLISDISSVRPDDLYLLVFNRWLNTTYDKTNFATLSATIDGRLFTGLPLGGTLETGAMTHHSYGMPMIAGSSVKGAVRSYAEHLFAERDSDGRICYQDKKVVVQANKQALLDVLFGTDSDDENANAGYLIWHDAWWIPKAEIREIDKDGKKESKLALSENENKPFVGEIVTVHHQKYYNGDLPEALDIENPIPNQQITIQGSFYFVIEGESRWAKFAQMLLQDMLVEQGVGAKGSNGYGYFQLSNTDIQPYLDIVANKAEQAKAKQEAQALQNAIQGLNGNQKLIYLFKNELAKLSTSQWHGKPNVTIDIKINGESFWFASLFSRVETWHNDDQKYALEQVFVPNQKHLSKKMQDKIKGLKKKFN